MPKVEAKKKHRKIERIKSLGSLSVIQIFKNQHLANNRLAFEFENEDTEMVIVGLRACIHHTAQYPQNIKYMLY